MAMEKYAWSRGRVPKLKLTSKKIIILAVLTVLVVIGGTIAWVQISLYNQNQAAIVPLDEIEANVATYSQKGDTDGALRFYDQQVALHQNKADKQQILIMKSRFAAGAGRMDTAIDAAKQADNLGSTNQTLSAIAEIYVAKGDKAQALVYYKKILALAPKNDAKKLFSQGPTLQDKIRELEQ